MDTKKIILMVGIVLLAFVVIVFAVDPDQPVLNSPANDTVVYDNQAILNITVTDDDSDYLNVSFYQYYGVGFSPYAGFLSQSSYSYKNLSYTYTTIDFLDWLNKSSTITCCWPSSDAGGTQNATYNISGISSEFEVLEFKQSYYSYNNNNWDWVYTIMDIYNFTSNSFVNIYTLNDTSPLGCNINYWNITLTNEYIQNNNIQIRFYMKEHDPNTGARTGGAANCDGVAFSDDIAFINFKLKTNKLLNTTTNTANNSYANYTWTSLANGDYNWFATITDSVNTTTSPVYAFSVYDYNYTVNHTTPVLETSSQTFTLNITRNSTYIDDGNATLHYNGTDYLVDATVYDNYLLFSKTLTIPSVSTETNITLNWTYEFWNPANNSRENNRTEDFTQLIYNIDMDDCSTYSIVALNFSLIEESNNASIAGDMDFTFSLVQEGTTINYSKSVTGINSTAFCIPTNDVSFTAQLQSEYSATGYDAHSYFAYNLAVTNATQYIYYYLTNGTTIVEFTVLDQSGNEIENAYIKVMKYDVGTGTYKTTEVLKTDELGKALGNIILDTAWYKFMVEYLGTTYLDTSATKMTSTTRTFTINLLSDFFDRYTDVIYGIYSTLNYTDATGNFAFTYSDPDGNYHQGCLKVTKEGLAGQTLINETCVSSTAATILVNVNDSGSINGTYTAVGYVLFDDMYVLNTLSKTWGHLSDIYGKEGLFYVFFIVLTVVMVGIFSPKLAVILGVIGLVFSNILGFIFIEAGWLVVIIIAAGLTLYRMREN